MSNSQDHGNYPESLDRGWRAPHPHLLPDGVSQRELHESLLCKRQASYPGIGTRQAVPEKTSIHLGGYRLRPTLKYIDSHTPSSVAPPPLPPRQSARRNQDIRFEHAENTSRELAGLSKRSAVVDDCGNDAGGGRETTRNASD